jgi:OHCU decarboxylase
MKTKLENLNNASFDAAFVDFLSCCGSKKWAKKMSESRPFESLDQLIEAAEKISQNLETADWLEAFSAHPKIGAKKAVPQATEQSANWSNHEQSGVQTASEKILDELATANRLYEERFGFIFIVCATGKNADEMLEICRSRLGNSDEAEIPIAAAEQRKITEIRLRKLLD